MFPAAVAAVGRRWRGGSSLSVPAPDGGIVTHGDEDAAVTAEAGLPDGRRALGERQRGAPGERDETALVRSPTNQLMNLF